MFKLAQSIERCVLRFLNLKFIIYSHRMIHLPILDTVKISKALMNVYSSDGKIYWCAEPNPAVGNKPRVKYRENHRILGIN